ncbi:hypothetical protein [Ruminiclostridium cellobioparum]|uniref:hypothetical protein n=1 Tax=Ruminiclostridium cellobioparum TaxID=29355 RepID=UPI0004826A27|nr:hypothetical protein [Ruminiclostridium cellobioparum]
MNYLLYCAFGETKYINMAVYSILSYINSYGNPGKEISLVIFTNNVIPFKKALSEYEGNIIYEKISDSTLDDWLNGTNYMPRLKIKSLQYFFEKYTGNVLFIDCDTFHIKNIEHLFDKINDNRFILFSKCPSIREYLKFLGEYFKKYPTDFPFSLYKLCLDLEKTGFITDGQKKYSISLSFCEYNSGVIGMNAKYLPLLDEVLNLSDIIYKKYHYWCAEEFAFSYVISQIQEIVTCEDSIYHYFNDKWCRFILADLFGCNDENDIDEFDKYLKQNNLASLKGSININCEDLPFLIQFVREYILKLGTDILHFFYFTDDSYHAFVVKNFKTYKKIEQLMKAQSHL